MLDLVIVGAGHAGLAASQVAAVAGLEHLVLERGEVGQSWRTQRWDSFTMNTTSNAQRAVTALLGTKLGMTQVWDEQGRVVPVTVVQVDTNVITQVRNVEKDAGKCDIVFDHQ